MESDFERLKAQVERETAARDRLDDREAARQRGVCWSSLGGDRRPQPSPQLVAAARLARLRHWQASRAGRLLLALGEVQRTAQAAHATAEQARAAVSRGLDAELARCTDAVARLRAQAAALDRAASAASAAMDETSSSPLSGEACATNTASSSPSTGSSTSSAG